MDACMVVGLGNPGARYCFHRHNAGFMAVDRLAAEWHAAFEPFGRLALAASVRRGGVRCRLLKPLTFMNRSGRAVGEARDRFGIPLARLLLVSDDFNLPLGKIRIRRKGSHGGHNGLKSVIRTLGSEAFPRLRIGVGPVPEGMDPAAFVLEDFSRAERPLLDRVLHRAVEALRFWIETEDLDRCMTRFNGWVEGAPEAAE